MGLSEIELAEAVLDHLDSAELPRRDAFYMRAIAVAYCQLWEAVAEARAAGEPWTVIGNAVGVTELEAQRRFADLA